MSQIVSYFPIFDCLPKNIIENIRCFFVNQSDPFTKRGYCVTNEDKVYAIKIKITSDEFIGNNQWDSDSEEAIGKPQHVIISELCDKYIEEFFEGHYYMFARNKDNHIFVWGDEALFSNEKTVSEANHVTDGTSILCDDNCSASSNHFQRPQRMKYFDDKNIIDISCGINHCLALSSNGVLYLWAHLRTENNSNRMEWTQPFPKYTTTKNFNQKSWVEFFLRENCVTFPKVIELNENLENQIQSVFCFAYYSFVVTISGHIYELTENGFNHYFDLNYLQQKVSDFEDKNPNSSLDQSIDRNNVIEVKFLLKHFHICPYIIFRTLNGVYEYNESTDEIFRSETDSETIFEYFLLKYEMTYKTINLKDNQLYVHSFIDMNGITENIKLLKTSETIIPNIKQFCEHFHQKTAQSFKLKKVFRVFNDLPKNIESNVKCYYFIGSHDSVPACAFIVMSDSTVFANGINECGKLGFGHNEKVINYTRISELCGQNIEGSWIIEDFFEGENCMFARNDKNQIFGWGRNECGQLGRGFKCQENIFLKPQKIDYFDDKNIIKISCGSDHCLALSTEGMVYGWGNNKWGRTDLYGHLNILSPIKIDLTETIKFVHCYFIYPWYSSSAQISTDGKVIVCGDFKGLTSKEYRKLISEIPWSVKKIMGYFILSECGTVYRINIEEKKLTRIETDIKFKDLYAKVILETNICALQAKECVYEMFPRRYPTQQQPSELQKTDYLNFYDFYLHKYNLTYKTINIASDGFLITKDIKINQNYNKSNNQKLLQIEDKNVFDRKFEFHFEDIIKKGRGTFGDVFEVRNKSDKKLFAIKRIDLEGDLAAHSTLREVQILSELNSDFVVQYITAWIEGKVIDGQFVNYAYIQMELCSQNLNQVIQSMKNISDNFKTFKYYISCELFRELTECVDYLHSLTPPIIHRDLKPENVLISDGSDGRFIKLCDFGLAKVFTEEYEHTTGVIGTRKYSAPEVKNNSKNYDLNSDVYSLSVIAIELFDIKNSVKEIRKKRNLMSCGQHFDKLLERLSECLKKDFKERPDCKELLNRKNEWTVERPTPESCDNFWDFIEVLKSSENQFLHKYFGKIFQRIEPSYDDLVRLG